MRTRTIVLDGYEIRTLREALRSFRDDRRRIGSSYGHTKGVIALLEATKPKSGRWREHLEKGVAFITGVCGEQ